MSYLYNAVIFCGIIWYFLFYYVPVKYFLISISIMLLYVFAYIGLNYIILYEYITTYLKIISILIGLSSSLGPKPSLVEAK